MDIFGHNCLDEYKSVKITFSCALLTRHSPVLPGASVDNRVDQLVPSSLARDRRRLQSQMSVMVILVIKANLSLV